MRAFHEPMAYLMSAVMLISGCMPVAAVTSANQEQRAASAPSEDATPLERSLDDLLAASRGLGYVPPKPGSVGETDDSPTVESAPLPAEPDGDVVDGVESYATFCRQFRALSEGTWEWPAFEAELTSRLGALEETSDSAAEVPDSTDLRESLTGLERNQARYDDEQKAALEDCKVRLDEYVAALGVLQTLIHGPAEDESRFVLMNYADELRNLFEAAVADVHELRDGEMDKEAARSHVQAMLSPEGSVGRLYAFVNDNRATADESVELIRETVNVANAKREEFESAAARLQDLVPDPAFDDALIAFQEEDDDYWDTQKAVISALCPVLGLLFFLIWLFGGGGGDGDGDGNGGESGESNTPSESQGDTGQDGGSTSQGAEDEFALPADATANSTVKAAVEGDHVIQFFDRGGRTYLRVFVEKRTDPEHVWTVDFTIRELPDFGPMVDELPALTLTGLDVPDHRTKPLVAEFSRDDQPAYFVMWESAEDLEPELLGGSGSAEPPPNTTVEPVRVSGGGAHRVFLVRDTADRLQMIVRIDDDPNQELPPLSFTFGEKRLDDMFAEAIELRELELVFLNVGEFTDAYPVTLGVQGLETGVVMHVRWDAPGVPPRDLAD